MTDTDIESQLRETSIHWPGESVVDDVVNRVSLESNTSAATAASRETWLQTVIGVLAFGVIVSRDSSGVDEEVDGES
jgi:uncharacterized protein YlxP (DUF503 family)